MVFVHDLYGGGGNTGRSQTGGGTARVQSNPAQLSYSEAEDTPLAKQVRTRIYQKCGKLRNVWRMFDDGRSGSVSLSEVQDIGQQLNPYPAPKFLKDP